jgi:hypothetical protein
VSDRVATNLGSMLAGLYGGPQFSLLILGVLAFTFWAIRTAERLDS